MYIYLLLRNQGSYDVSLHMLHRAADNSLSASCSLSLTSVHTAVCVERGLQGVPTLPSAIYITYIIHAGVVRDPETNSLLI